MYVVKLSYVCALGTQGLKNINMYSVMYVNMYMFTTLTY